MVLESIIHLMLLYSLATRLGNYIPRIVQIYDEKGAAYTKRLVGRYMAWTLYHEEEIQTMLAKWKNTDWLQKKNKYIRICSSGSYKWLLSFDCPCFAFTN